MHGLTQIERQNARKRIEEDRDRIIVPCGVEGCVYYFITSGDMHFSVLYRDEWMRCQHCSHHTLQDLASF